MNSHIFDLITSEKSKDVFRSLDFFVEMAVIISVVGLAFFAVV
jgi:hypothetical protein